MCVIDNDRNLRSRKDQFEPSKRSLIEERVVNTCSASSPNKTAAPYTASRLYALKSPISLEPNSLTIYFQLKTFDCIADDLAFEVHHLLQPERLLFALYFSITMPRLSSAFTSANASELRSSKTSFGFDVVFKMSYDNRGDRDVGKIAPSNFNPAILSWSTACELYLHECTTASRLYHLRHQTVQLNRIRCCVRWRNNLVYNAMLNRRNEAGAIAQWTKKFIQQRGPQWFCRSLPVINQL